MHKIQTLRYVWITGGVITELVSAQEDVSYVSCADSATFFVLSQFQFFQVLQLGNFHPGIFIFSLIEGRLADAMLAANIV